MAQHQEQESRNIAQVLRGSHKFGVNAPLCYASCALFHGSQALAGSCSPRSCVNPSGVSEARPSVRCSAHRARLRGGYALARVGASRALWPQKTHDTLCPRARRGLQKPAKRCSPSMAHGALYARYSPATVAEAPAWAFAPAPCPLEKTKPRALYWRRGPPPVPVHALVWPPPRGAESAHILLVLCSLCEARRRCYALTGTLGNSYTYLPRFCSPRVRTLFTFRCGSTGVRAGHEVSTPDCKLV